MSKVFLVTGSSRGLGREIVTAVLAAGHRVMATARDPRTLEDLAATHGDRIRTARLDVTDADAAERVVTETVEAFGQKAASPGLRAAQLAALVEEQFGFPVHPRSVQRVLARVDGPKSTG